MKKHYQSLLWASVKATPIQEEAAAVPEVELLLGTPGDKPGLELRDVVTDCLKGDSALLATGRTPALAKLQAFF